MFTLWNVMTLAGALLGNLMGDPKAWGLDGAAIAAFCGLLWPRLVARDAVATAVVAAVVTVALVPVLPAGLPVLSAVVVGGGAAWHQIRRSAGPRGRGDVGLGAGRVAGVFRDQTGGRRQGKRTEAGFVADQRPMVRCRKVQIRAFIQACWALSAALRAASVFSQ